MHAGDDRSVGWKNRPILEPLESRILLSRSGVIDGDVFAAGQAWANAQVTLYETHSRGAKVLGTDETDSAGHFDIRYRKANRGSQLYLIASDDDDPADSARVYLAMAGNAGPDRDRTVAIN